MRLPDGVDALVEQIIAENAQTCVVVQSGTQCVMPWFDKAKAVIQAFYGGNEGGTGLASVLFGEHNPSGKMPLSMPMHEEDVPAHPFFPGSNGVSHYNEDVFVGYRGMLGRSAKMLAYFGHGLSYTTFELSDLQIAQFDVSLDQQLIRLEVSVMVENTGKQFEGAEVVQVYIAPPASSSLPRPLRELAGFAKIHLACGARQKADILLERSAFSYWDNTRRHGNHTGCWHVQPGEYTLMAGNSLISLPLVTTVNIKQGFTWLGL